ncbi:molybdopterin molybdenumtransferase MoeA [Corynebacterium hylobatis]|uniref:Molybdopterin molybdenumtransferase n=1 Tax=Corynebacterium hylobatis TaxID=1859290 RepID=A0A3S0AY44_9CORY|nr:gephyrin-like molybdotransferase Glp [Corynebacterium hylobatis]RSZ66172.1 molybdopterin molybdenumtransferase MoeA [Corynebacterium hylobatis]
MRSITEHLAALLDLDLASPGEPVSVTPVDAPGLVLAADAVAVLPVPPFSNSAMDGFLVRDGDLDGPGPWTLPVSGEIPAGGVAADVPAGAALRIMTGAPVGEHHGDLRVIPVEDTDIPGGPQPLPGSVTIHSVRPERRHIRALGENITPGEVVVPAGTRVDPGAVAALISAGLPRVTVFPRPRVAVLSSGDELVEPGMHPGPGQLPDSNRPMLAALFAEQGIEVTQVHSGDRPLDFRAVLDRLCATHDLVVTTGGVSVGAFDVVREATSGEGVWFGTVAQRPGSPQGLGTRGRAVLMCLPGNPVAAFVSWCLYVPPLLAALSGTVPTRGLWERPHIRATVAEGVSFPASPERTFLAPVHLDWSGGRPVAAPFNRHSTGSHLVASLAGTDGVALIEPGTSRLQGGDTVGVLLRRP